MSTRRYLALGHLDIQIKLPYEPSWSQRGSLGYARFVCHPFY
jgi:hypothetical protein